MSVIRQKCPKLDGTVRNQMVLSVIRRKRSESGGNVRNQTEASCGIRDLCHLFPCLQIGKRLKKLNNIIGTNLTLATMEKDTANK